MLLRTEKLSKSFNGVYALSNINFEVEAGEVHGLVGENGAGKSTLIKMLTGVYSIDEGTVFWISRLRFRILHRVGHLASMLCTRTEH